MKSCYSNDIDWWIVAEYNPSIGGVATILCADSFLPHTLFYRFLGRFFLIEYFRFWSIRKERRHPKDVEVIGLPHGVI